MNQQPTLTLNTPALLGELQQRFKATCDRVVIALAAIDRLQDGAELSPVPGVFRRTSFGEEPTSNLESRDDCRSWLAGVGLCEAFESFGILCEDAWRMLALANQGQVRLEKLVHVEEVTLRDIADATIADKCKAFDRFGIIKKLDELENGYDVKPAWRTELETLNAARNCLTHRSGIVEEDDVNDTAGQCLGVRYRAAVLVLTEPDGKKTVLRKRKVVKKGGRVSINFTDPREKTFQIGEQILFDPQEFMDLLHTLRFAGEEILKGINVRINNLLRPPS